MRAADIQIKKEENLGLAINCSRYGKWQPIRAPDKQIRFFLSKLQYLVDLISSCRYTVDIVVLAICTGKQTRYFVKTDEQ